MSEFSEIAWGIPDVKRDLSYSSSTDEESPATAVAAFKALILERPDIGIPCNFFHLRINSNGIAANLSYIN